MNTHQCFPQFDIAELIEGIEIRADGARKQDRILWNNGQTGAQVVEFNLRNIDAINRNAAFPSLKEAKEGE